MRSEPHGAWPSRSGRKGALPMACSLPAASASRCGEEHRTRSPVGDPSPQAASSSLNKARPGPMCSVRRVWWRHHRLRCDAVGVEQRKAARSETQARRLSVS